MQIKIFNENIAEQNSYLIIKGKEAVVIDPGFNGEMIAEYLDQEQIILTDVLLTHGHFDHI
ncbi:MAG: MBL fold metallo-hydrolase, partial [Candidatus Izemoplasmatales bacterium]|nr:MBL fold metallo-hydrolase [Candidatus Izemoplasmatales bacterium]